MGISRLSIQTEDFDAAREIALLRQHDARVGAVCSFIGTVPMRATTGRRSAPWNSSTIPA